MNKYFLASLFIILNSVFLTAQQELSLHFVRNIWQSNLTNPALSPSEKKFQIALPSVYFNVNSPDYTINELFKPTSGRTLSLKDLVDNRLKDRNRLDADVQVQTLGLAYNITDAFQINAYHGVNGSPNIDVSSDAIKLLLQGNNQFLGKTAILDSYANGSTYSVIGIGSNYKISDNFTIGGRVKFLKGIAGIFTTNDKLSATFDPNTFEINIVNNIDVKTYTADKLLDLRTGGDLLKNSFGGANSGMSFDLGATMTLGKVTFAASAIDLGGAINWKNEGKGYATNGTFKFSGFTSDDLFNLDKIKFDKLVDSLKQVVGFKETTDPEYTQKIPTKLYLSTMYKFSDKLDFGLLLYTETGGEKTNIGTAFNTTFHISDNFQVGGTWAYRNKSAANIGLNVVASLGPVQVYAITDNIVNAIRPYDSKRSNGRMGVNVSF
jgi:hypothetical protein